MEALKLERSFVFFSNSILLGIGLAMDAFSVSLANGMNEPKMKRIKNKETEEESSDVGFGALIVQGIATSIDALSCGFTISHYGLAMAFICSLLIAVTTFMICISGLFIGRKFGMKLANKASILGGAILIFIGLEIWVTGVFF